MQIIITNIFFNLPRILAILCFLIINKIASKLDNNSPIIAVFDAENSIPMKQIKIINKLYLFFFKKGKVTIEAMINDKEA
jgi:hypothetical protein